MYWKYKEAEKNANKKVNIGGKGPEEDKPAVARKIKTFTMANVNDFMEFETITDNMIVKKEGFSYLMVVECQGINYDLMSGVEKNSVEEGFVQFLNTLRHSIQLYVQTRTINLDESIEKYQEKVGNIQLEFEKLQMEYNQAVKSGIYNQRQIDAMYFELTKQKNLMEYGKDIITNTQKMSLNKNVLNKKYYVVIPYFVETVAESHYSKDEKKDMAFSELYTRAQAVISSLMVCGVNGKILNSEELAELLYVAYNRDEAEIFGMDKAIQARYDELYSTAEDVMDKKMKALDKQIADAAVEKAKQVVNEVRTDKEKALREKEQNAGDYISELAKMVIEQNNKIVGEDIADEAIERIKDEEKERRESNAKIGA